MPDLLAPGYPQALVLLAVRVTGLLLVAPMYSAKTIPVAIRTAVLLVLTLLLAPVAWQGAGANAPLLALTPAAAAAELLVGLALGLGAALLVGAVEMAGDLVTTTTALSGAALMDPLNGTSSSVLTQFAQLFAVTVLLALDGHLVMLQALAGSLHEVPVGASVDLEAGLAHLVQSGATLFVLGLRFAAPVVAATLLGNVALAVLTRAAPQLNVFTVAFPIQIAIGLTAFVAALVFVATWFTGWSGHYAGALEQLFAGLLRER